MTDLISDLTQFIRAEREIDAPPPAAAPAAPSDLLEQLRNAARIYDKRSDDFAAGKGDTCRDLARRLERYGRFVSDRQSDFARKLVQWSQPRQRDAGSTVPASDFASSHAPTPRPRTWAMLQPFARVTIGEARFVKKNAEPLWWILWGEGDGACVGKITAEGAVGFARKIRLLQVDPATIKAALDHIEQDPEAALKAHGLATGSCGCCGRELTDPVSIANGIGPICAGKLGGGF